MVHDLNYHFIPELLDARRNFFYRTAFPLLLRRNDRIIVPSRHTAEAIRDHLHIAQDKIRVVYEGVSTPTAQPLPHGRENGHILFVGMLHPHKNVEQLIRACARIASKISEPLTIVGGDPGNEEYRLKAIANELGVGERVTFQGFVDEVEPYYTQARLFVFPSQYEGFGLPPLEAMARGVPVVASNRASVPEVVGKAALVVDPDDVGALAEAMYRVLSDHGLRQELIQAGYQRVQQFTWDRAAKSTIDVFKEVYAGRRSQVNRH